MSTVANPPGCRRCGRALFHDAFGEGWCPVHGTVEFVALVHDALDTGSVRVGASPGDGCSDHPECLTCPFERCRFDRAERPPAAATWVRREGRWSDALGTFEWVEVAMTG